MEMLEGREHVLPALQVCVTATASSVGGNRRGTPTPSAHRASASANYTGEAAWNSAKQHTRCGGGRFCACHVAWVW